MNQERQRDDTGKPTAAPDSTFASDDWFSRMAPFAWYTRQRPLYVGGNEVELLRGGDALFPAMRQAFEAARHHIWLTTYIFHNDASAQAVVDVLVKAAARGVRVRVVVDGFGSNRTLGWLHERFTPAGVGFVVFRPVHSWLSIFQPDQMRRLHHKLCVVDAEVAFVGGINIIDDRLDVRHGPSDTPRLDYAVRLRGQVVAPIEQTARADWTRAWLGRDWRDELLDVARSAHPFVKARRTLRQLSHRSGDPQWSPVARAMRDRSPIRAAFVVRDNFRQRRTIERAYIGAIKSARRRVTVVVPYFYPGRMFRLALREAAQRGVEVRLVLQGKIDYRVAAIAARALYDELLAHGVRIFEYQPAYLHAKVAVVDERWATVGSSNIDPLSLLVNLEANVIVRDAAFARTLSVELDAALAHSHEIRPQPRGWWGRHWWGRLRRGFVAGCARLYLRVAGATGKY